MKKRFQKILCPIDFDENSIAALDVACDLAREFQSFVYLLHVVPTVPAPALGIPIEPWPMTERDAREKLEAMAREHVEGKARYKVLTRSGDPARLILDQISDLKTDCVVMATHGRRGLKRILLGSVAESVVRLATCPVLTVRPEAGSEEAATKTAEA